MMWAFIGVAKWLFKDFHYEWLVEGFDKNIRIELDFLREAANMKRTAHFLTENRFSAIHVPHLMLAPSKRLLVMEFIQGVHLDQLKSLTQMGIDARALSILFSRMIVKMIHQEGFVHADTHSGNLMARKVGNKDQLVLLDHGLYQELDRELLRNYNQFWLGLILNKPLLLEEGAKGLGTSDPKMLRQMVTSMSEKDL